MSARTIFWSLVVAYYAILFAVWHFRRRQRIRLSSMSPDERAAFERYWKWCF